jgi:nucleotide-binding universal stress UspA family protein
MTYKRILVHIDDTAASERRVGAAADIARGFGANLVGMYFSPSVAREVDPAQLPPPEIAMRMSQRELRDRVESAFGARAASMGVPDVEVRVLEGDAITEAIAEMRCADLSVLSQPDVTPETGGFERRLAEQAPLASGSPILFIPYAPATKGIGEHVVIAWDGGREAARAVRDALPLLLKAKRVTVLSLGARAKLGQDAGHSQARLAAYLALHGIEPNLREMVCDAAEAGELLLSQLADLAADLLVMGAYGHARVREIMLGGVTRTMLESMTVPVLMSH